MIFTAYKIYNYSGQSECDKQRAEKTDLNAIELPLETNNPNAGLPKNPKDFKPVIPKWPTPTGKTKMIARKHCEKKIKQSNTYKSCHRVLGQRFNIMGALDQCVADTLVSLILYSHTSFSVYLYLQNILW